MPFETQLGVGAIILVFLFFMVLVAWAERRAGGSFDDVRTAGDADHDRAAPAAADPVVEPDERQAA